MIYRIKLEWALFILSLSLLIGQTLGDHFHFLQVFYKNALGHILIGFFLFVLSFKISFVLRNNKYPFLVYSLIILIIGFFGLEFLLTVHEYTHLTYILSYLMIFTIGGFGVVFQENRIKIKKYSYLILLGISTGFICQYFVKSQWIYTSVFCSFLILLFYQIVQLRYEKWELGLYAFLVLTALIQYFVKSQTAILPNQHQYNDRLIYSKITNKHQVDITSWKENYWYYLDNKVQFSSHDEWLYSEPMVHSIIQVLEDKSNVLLIGGENGILVKELLKYDEVEKIDLFITDLELFNIANTNHILLELNDGALYNERIDTISSLIDRNRYNAIFIDIPDPINKDWNKYYTRKFYAQCDILLTHDGALITQAGSPYYASKAFNSINKTIQSAGFNTLPLHNQVLSLGQWGWVLGSKRLSQDQMILKLLEFDNSIVHTRWLNNESMQMLYSFGKSLKSLDSIEINTLMNPVLIDYYREGNYRFR